MTGGSVPATGPVLGYGTNGFADHPLESALDVLQAAGYRAVALTLGHPHLDPFAPDWRERVARLRASLERRGFRVVIETGARYLLHPTIKHAPTLVDASCEPRLRFLERAIEIAALLGADAVSLWSGVLPVDTTPEQGWSRLVERMRGVVDSATARGVRLGLEPEPGMLVETVADALRLRTELGDPPALGITVDIGHCVVVEPGGVAGALRGAGKLLVNVQLDDMLPERHEHLAFGAGAVDLAEAFAVLAEIGYRGIAAVELPRHSHDAPRLAATSIAALRAAAAAATATATATATTEASASTSAEQAAPPAATEPASVAHPPVVHPPAVHPWLAQQLAIVAEHPDRVDRVFPAVGRGVGRAHADEARAALLVGVAVTLDPPELAETLTRLYRHGDDAERRGVLTGLDALAAVGATPPGGPVAAAGVALVLESLRANDSRLVAAALGPFAEEHLDEHSWRHGVLKLVFLGVPLSAVAGLERRRDPELARMAARFADERRAAGRSVPDDALLLVT